MELNFDAAGVIMLYLGIGVLVMAAMIHQFNKPDMTELREMIPERAIVPFMVLWGVMWPVVGVIFVREVWRSYRRARADK